MKFSGSAELFGGSECFFFVNLCLVKDSEAKFMKFSGSAELFGGSENLKPPHTTKK